MAQTLDKVQREVQREARELPHQVERGLKAIVPAEQEPLIDEGKRILRRYLNLPLSFRVEYEIEKARNILRNLKDFPAYIDGKLVSSQIRQADAVAFLTIGRAGIFLTGQIGSGLVIARLSDGSWSAPSAIGYAGSGFGLQGGFELTDYVLILKRQAVDTFAATNQIVLSGDVGVTVLLGRHGTADLHFGKKRLGFALGWAASKGWYAGASASAGLIHTRHAINKKFYGRDVDPSDLLHGKTSRPRAAKPLYDSLNEVQHTSR